MIHKDINQKRNIKSKIMDDDTVKMILQQRLLGDIVEQIFVNREKH